MGVDGRPGEKPQDNNKQSANGELQAAIAAAQEFNGTIQGAIQLVVQKISEAKQEILVAKTTAIVSIQVERDNALAAIHSAKPAQSTADSPKITRDPLVKGKSNPTAG